MTKISAIVLTKNEEENIADCLKSLAFCTEIIVIDDESEDETIQIAKKHDAKVFVRPLHNNFSEQRNFALTKATGDWVLFLDADERISKELQQEILNAIEKPHAPEGFYFRRFDYMWGRLLSHGEIGALSILRLVKHNAALWKGEVHETLSLQGPTGQFVNPILHYPHPSVSEFLEAINIYSTIRAHELRRKHVHTNQIEIVVYPLGKFIQNFLFRGGFLDGTPGLVFATIMSFHSFLVRGKLWLLWQKK